MNDLERDLENLFKQRAHDVDAPVLAPDAVLRRGRRRQARTVAGGALVGVLAILVSASVVSRASRPDALPARTTSIGGVPVTAPAGWTLIDDWPLSTLLPTSSESCQFSSTGTAVAANGDPIDPSPTDVQPESAQSCTTTPTPLPAGLPVLQLANFEIPLYETVCGLAENPPTDLPADGVAVYVADMAGAVDTNNLLAQCPGTENVTDGSVMTTFADEQVSTVYAAVMVAGSEASAPDLQIAHDYMQSLGGIRITPIGPGSPAGVRYVMAAGDAGSDHWRLEVGVPLQAGTDTPQVEASLVTTQADRQGSVTQEPPKGGASIEDTYQDLADGTVIHWGTASPDVAGLGEVAPDGSSVSATMFRWPAGIRTLPGVSGALDGSIWFAIADQRGELHPQIFSSPQQTAGPSASATTAGSALDYITLANGTVVATGNDLGHTWEMRANDGTILLLLDGQLIDRGVTSFVNGSSTQIDVTGGTFWIGMHDPTVTSLSVTIDATEAAPASTVAGRWMPTMDNIGAPGRAWIMALPGSGTGLRSIDEDLPGFVSWPTVPLRPGSIMGGGGDGTVSWGLSWQDHQCVLLRVLGADPVDSGTSECLRSWYDLSGNGEPPQVAGVYGQQHATIAIVMPSDTTVNNASCGEAARIQCDEWRMESSYAGTAFWVTTIPVGQDLTLRLDHNGDDLGGPIRIQVTDGGIQVNGVTATASP